ncbi:glycosyltransferase family 2 protein [Lactobacillus delbrueckii]|uniref:glycosyltransferase family 2 protein n=1 Tax=Lactobacillus delbrueckii TaxID=1584 RepID=UPI0023E466B6|nr:glycosyltransferase family 2 protein [Lactobacillus delbrueckii]MDF4030592.1 glycosyltransferase family 2 protein [Lactobacillus delbrueckii]
MDNNMLTEERKKVLGGVVTYNPEILRLRENLESLTKQLDTIYIFDNGSKNLDDIERLLDSFSNNFKLHKAPKNMGIAYALKEIMNYAQKEKYDWVLSVDQDSVLNEKLVDEYMSALSSYHGNDIGMLTCLIKDRNFKDESVEKQKEALKEVPICITSASLTNIKNYFLTDGYDENLFIDLVDTDICLSLRERGFKILRLNFLGIFHEIGHGENKKILWKNVIVHHSSVFREYYMSRNTVILNRKHPQLYPKSTMVKGLIHNLLIITLFEEGKKERLHNFHKGWTRGLIMSRKRPK